MYIRTILIALAIKHNGNWESILKDLQLKEFPKIEEAIESVSQIKCNVLTIFDSDYPQYLKECYMPPFVLFYKGDISLLNNHEKHLAVVGTRNPSKYAIDATKEIVKGVAKEYVIVSGMASGIDRIAHEVTIDNGGKTIAVIGHGFNYCFPNENRDIYKKMQIEHLVISEYPPNCPPTGDNFPPRNRIIAQLSRCVLITEGGLRSGTFITANYALTFNKDVLCLPSSDLNNSLCNRLIREGAILVESSEHVREMMERISYYRK